MEHQVNTFIVKIYIEVNFFFNHPLYISAYIRFFSLFLIQGSHSCGQPSDSLGDLVIGLHIIGFWSSGRICFYPKTSHQLDAETKAFTREACVNTTLYLDKKLEKQPKSPKSLKWHLCNLCLFLLKVSTDIAILCTPDPGRLYFSPRNISIKLSHHFLLHFPIVMGSYDHHAKYQGVFMDLK